MGDPLQKLRILAQAESVLLQLKVRRVATQTVLMVISVFLLLLTIGLLNLAAYEFLREQFPTYQAALLVALGNGVLAGLLLFYAWRVSRRPEPAMARELRDLAREGLQSDMQQFRQGITHPLQSLGALSSMGSSRMGHAAKASIWTGLFQAALLAARFLLRRRKKK